MTTTADARLPDIIDNYADPPTDPAEIAPLLIAAGPDGQDRTDLFGRIQQAVGRRHVNDIWHAACDLEDAALKESTR